MSQSCDDTLANSRTVESYTMRQKLVCATVNLYGGSRPTTVFLKKRNETDTVNDDNCSRNNTVMNRAETEQKPKKRTL